MATRHVVKPNGEHELKHIDIFAQNMVPYFQHRDYLDHTNYFSKGSNFVKDKLDKHLRNFNDLEGDLRRNDSEVFINNNGVYHGQQTKLKLREGSLLSDFMSSSKEINIEGKNEKLDMAQYFTLTNGLPSQRPLLFMQYPSVRHGTDTASFGKFPCSGGEKGPNKYYQPGSKIMVRWQIENPLSSGKCAIKLAENNPQNLSSYKALTPSNVNVDSDGYFSCGNLEQSSEGVEIAVPSDSSCVECTLQLVYKTQEFGEMYQCSDISTAYFETTNDCDKPCLNQGVCFKGQCVCAKGFFGQYCENLINPDVAAKGANQEYKTIKPELTKSTTKKNNGVKYLNYTPEAEKLNLENKTDKKSETQIKALQFYEGLSNTHSSSSSGGLSWYWWYLIWLLIALVVFAIIALLVYFLCKDKAMAIINGDKSARPRSNTREPLSNRKSNVSQNERDRPKDSSRGSSAKKDRSSRDKNLSSDKNKESDSAAKKAESDRKSRDKAKSSDKSRERNKSKDSTKK